MQTNTNDIEIQIKALPDTEKLKLVDIILQGLDKPDPELDKVWANEARKRWTAYKQGKIGSVGYEEVMTKYKNR